MHCNEFLGRYSDYDDSLLSSSDEALFRRHLSECASCRRYDRVLRKGRMVARQLPPPEPSPDFIPHLQGRLRVLRGSRTAWLPRLPAALAAVTVLVVSAAGMLVLRAAPPSAGAIPESAAGALPGAFELPEDHRLAGPSWRSEDGRVVGLPPGWSADPRDWTVGGVAPRLAASYSPLVTGPPAFRLDRGWSNRSMSYSARPTLD
jgi:hypothetical protein